MSGGTQPWVMRFCSQCKPIAAGVRAKEASE